MKFSILTASYNALDGLKDVMSQLQAQEGGVEVEHVVVDGGSTDGTVEALREWENERSTFNIELPTSNYSMKWVSEPDEGLYDALNKGLKMATGDVVGILHTDDVWEKGVLLRVAGAFGANGGWGMADGEGGGDKCEGGRLNVGDEEEVMGQRSFVTGLGRESGGSEGKPLQVRTPYELPEGVYGDLWYVDAEDICKVKRVWRSGGYDPKKWIHGWMPPHPALFVTRELVQRVGEYRLDLGSAADYEWMLRAGVVHEARLRYLPERLVRMRVGGQSNASVQGRLKAHDADRRAWELNGLKPKPWTLKMKVIRKLPQWVEGVFCGGKRGKSEH
ncbi:glycosyltransferase [Kiritimatiellota bacterium B12222]|nr:glycosyltransferase [Kiritimatiellota bacterium B12222]